MSAGLLWALLVPPPLVLERLLLCMCLTMIHVLIWLLYSFRQLRCIASCSLFSSSDSERRQRTREEILQQQEFCAAVRLRQRRDPVHEYEEHARREAWVRPLILVLIQSSIPHLDLCLRIFLSFYHRTTTHWLLLSRPALPVPNFET